MTQRMVTLRSYQPLVGCLLLLTVVLCCSIWPTTANPQLECRVRQYLQFRAEKPGCRAQTLSVDACYGRCDTYEFPQLQIPYKSSHHTMCSYRNVRLDSIELSDCDAGVNRTFVYRSAMSCSCRRCTPSNTFCLGL